MIPRVFSGLPGSRPNCGGPCTAGAARCRCAGVERLPLLPRSSSGAEKALPSVSQIPIGETDGKMIRQLESNKDTTAAGVAKAAAAFQRKRCEKNNSTVTVSSLLNKSLLRGKIYQEQHNYSGFGNKNLRYLNLCDSVQVMQKPI